MSYHKIDGDEYRKGEYNKVKPIPHVFKKDLFDIVKHYLLKLINCVKFPKRSYEYPHHFSEKYLNI